MAIFPPVPLNLFNQRDKDITDRMEKFYDEVIATNAYYWGEADLDTRFSAGDASLFNEIYGTLPINRRRQFSFNRINRIVNLIEGHQRRNRKSTIITPIENGDTETADQYTKILLWINQQENVLETISQAFRGALITGLNLLQVWVDYRQDPISGMIRVDNCSYNTFLIDPYFKKSDLSDCNTIWKRSFLSKQEVCSLMPDKEDEIMQLMETNSRDGKFYLMPETFQFMNQNFLSYDEYYYRTYRNQKMLVDTQTGETQEWRGQLKENLDDFLRYYPQITFIERDIPTVNVSIVVQGKVMYDGPQIGGDCMPFVPVMTYYDPNLPDFRFRLRGVVRDLRDSQFLYNRRKAIELDILESQVNSGWIYKEDALVDPKDVFMSGQGKGIALKRQAQMTDIQQIQSPAIPPQVMQLSEMLGKEMLEISGVNEELLGSADDSKAGILSMFRQHAGLTTLQGLFDQLDTSQRILGRLMLNVIQTNFTPGKVKRIIAQEPTPQFYNKAFGRYDAAVEEGLNTTTQRQMQFAQLLHLKEIGVMIPDDVLIDSCTVENKKQLMESIQQSQQQNAQMQQARAQAEMQEIQARIQLAQARATADTGLGLERVSRIQENKSLAVERQAAAVRDENEAFLNMVKALKEMDTIDIEQVEKLVAMQQIIKSQEQANQPKETQVPQ